MAGTRSSPRSWASLLGFLQGDLASSVEVMARRLQVIMNPDPHLQPGLGEPNGYAGIARRGELDRLLLSEWLLADEEPLEFMRRLAMGELSYLRRESAEPRTSTRLVVLVDVGPDQLGAPRLVHLAGLVVLHRRAEAQRAPLALGLLGDDPGNYRTGELPEQASRWRLARSAGRPSADHLRAWLGSLEPSDRGWIFGAEGALADGAENERDLPLRHLSARELEWGADGATSMKVSVDHRRVVLPLPEPAKAIALLRGQGLRRRPAAPIDRPHESLRFPRFSGNGRRLLCRTDHADELIAITVPHGQPVGKPRPRRHQFPGPILAAAVVGTRTVALISDAGAIRVVVKGKRLGRVDTIDVASAKLELDERSIASIVDSDLGPLFFASGRILVQLAGQWWFIDPPDVAAKADFVVVAASPATDSPRIARNEFGQVQVWPSPGVPVAKGRRIFFGPLDATAGETADGEFTIVGYRHQPTTVRVGADVRVLGVTATTGDGPFLVVQSAGERILRLEGPNRSRTLTMASGDVTDVSLHPTEPLLAVQRGDGTIEVFELPDGTPLAVMLPDRP